MTQTAETIEAHAMRLPRHDRAKIALHLLDSLEPIAVDDSPEAIQRAWIEESNKRLHAYRRGDMPGYDVDEVIAELESTTS